MEAKQKNIIQYVFPAVFYDDDNQITVVFPDLNIFTEGNSFEEAYLYAKDYLRVYCSYANKYEIDIEVPSKFEKIKERFKPASVMLIDAVASK